MADASTYLMTGQEVDSFVGEAKAGYYKEKWGAHPDTQFYKGWNWVAFPFFFEWAAYRKMYREAALMYLVVLLCSVVIAFLPFNTEFIAELWGFGMKLLFSFLANGLYRRKALRTVKETADMDGDAKLCYLKKKGGTSVPSVFAVLALEFLQAFVTIF